MVISKYNESSLKDIVIPAQAGIHFKDWLRLQWIPDQVRDDADYCHCEPVGRGNLSKPRRLPRRCAPRNDGHVI